MTTHLHIVPKGAYAVAMGETGGLVVAELFGGPCLWYCSNKTGQPESREEFTQLFERAAHKLGYSRDYRFKSGWKKNI